MDPKKQAEERARNKRWGIITLVTLVVLGPPMFWALNKLPGPLWWALDITFAVICLAGAAFGSTKERRRHARIGTLPPERPRKLY